MLAELRIRDYALIDDLTIEFGPGLNVLTGETGAGKSIILGALSLVLGEKPETSMVRHGADQAQVEARFENATALADGCAEIGLEVPDNTLILRRRAAKTGKSTAYANDSAITITALRRLGDRLVDLHGQHQHQLLLRPEVHLDILDAYAQISDERARLAAEFHRLAVSRQDLARLETELAERKQRRDLTEFQARELLDAAVEPGESERLAQEKELLASTERRHSLAAQLAELLSEADSSVTDQLGTCARLLAELEGLDRKLIGRHQVLATAQGTIEELWRELVSYREDIQFSPDRLEEVNARLYLIERLQKRYGVGPDELAELGKRLQQELDSVELDETRCRELQERIARDQQRLLDSARRLSARRRKAKARLESAVRKEFGSLGLDKADLAVRILNPEPLTPEAVTPTGVDQVEFLFNANPGETLRPLCKVASGGELSRIMLALKSVLSGVELVPVMVFDEIDVGIGGRVAEAVGKRLAAIGRNQQVVCITHLPQIAKYADRHFLVTKSTRGRRTTTSISPVAGDDRVSELARMSAGAAITETGLAHAREMLKQASRHG